MIGTVGDPQLRQPSWSSFLRRYPSTACEGGSRRCSSHEHPVHLSKSKTATCSPHCRLRFSALECCFHRGLQASVARRSSTMKALKGSQKVGRLGRESIPPLAASPKLSGCRIYFIQVLNFFAIRPRLFTPPDRSLTIPIRRPALDHDLLYLVLFQQVCHACSGCTIFIECSGRWNVDVDDH